MPTTFRLIKLPNAWNTAPALVVIGRKERLASDKVVAQLPEAVRALWGDMLEALRPGDKGVSTTTWIPADGATTRVVAGALPEPCSRHNSPARPHALADLLSRAVPGAVDAHVVLLLDDRSHALASVGAAARAFPLYTHKGERGTEREVSVSLAAEDLKGIDPGRLGLEHAAEGVRLAARLVDMPTSELHTDAFVAEASAAAAALGKVEIHVIQGGDLRDRGFGGLWGVGRAATHLPALVHLSHTPKRAKRTVAWVGKGIVYDTGGLSLKTKGGMPGMKRDMAGAAAVLGAFQAAVRMRLPIRLHAILCLAENSVGPESTRPDDILTMYSGRTVEVNNTDAEGRLVLADGVAYAAREVKPDVIVDIATLTGAQLIATGRRHAAILCNDADLERAAVEAGRASGDLCHPLPWAPEFWRAEFKSKVADMKNSVKDRMNAQSSCAAWFVNSHLKDYDGQWLHVDMAGPACSEGVATGYGVALLLELFGRKR